MLKRSMPVKVTCRLKSSALAEAVGTTPGFLSQALTPLVAVGWVRSDPGPTGGYTAVADPSAVSVLDVIEAVDGDTDGGRCVVADRACLATAPCVLHEAWKRARHELTSTLASMSLVAKYTPQFDGRPSDPGDMPHSAPTVPVALRRKV